MSVWVATCAPDLTDSTPLDTLGQVGAPTFSHARPGGCLAAHLTLDIAATANPYQLTPGRFLRIYSGAMPVWTGVLDDPTRGRPWTISGFGLAGLAKRYAPLDATATLTANPQTAVTQAIARGLPWTDGGTIPTGVVATDTEFSNLADLLDFHANANGMSWGVDATRTLFFTADPTGTPDVYVTNLDIPGGRTVAGLATTLVGKYLNSATGGAVAYVSVSTAAGTGAGPLGTYEQLVDLSGKGTMTGATATTILTNTLARLGARAQFTGPLDVEPRMVTAGNGLPLTDLTTLRDGLLMRLLGVAPDPFTGEVNYSTVLDIAIGEVEVDTSTGHARITPQGARRDDLSTLLENAAAAL